MKANATINTSLFRNFNVSTASISGGTLVCHPMRAAGNYSGTVFLNDVEVGGFTLECSDAAAEPQADIDLYAIHQQRERDCGCGGLRSFKVSTGGYAVFYSSFGAGGYQVVLTNLQKARQPGSYTTRMLEKGDVVVFMLLRPGTYEAFGQNNQRCRLQVNTMENSRPEAYNKALMNPAALALNDNGFSQQELSVMPGQGIVVNLEAEGSIDIRLAEATDAEEPTGRKKRRWVNPKYKQ